MKTICLLLLLLRRHTQSICAHHRVSSYVESPVDCILLSRDYLMRDECSRVCAFTHAIEAAVVFILKIFVLPKVTTLVIFTINNNCLHISTHPCISVCVCFACNMCIYVWTVIFLTISPLLLFSFLSSLQLTRTQWKYGKVNIVVLSRLLTN